MARSYDMRTRSLAAAGTRTAIVDAAHRLLNQRDSTALTLQELAAAAGVSRQTIYKSIGSRAQVLAAVFEDQGRLISFGRVLAAMELPDPLAAVVATVRESCRAWSVMPDAIRKTLALSALDPEIGALVQTYERHRRAKVATLARRAYRAGAAGTRPRGQEAGTTLALLTSFTTFDQLRVEYDETRSTELLVRLARALFNDRPAVGADRR
jgi:AcrR family transcriptional regulator